MLDLRIQDDLHKIIFILWHFPWPSNAYRLHIIGEKPQLASSKRYTVSRRAENPTHTLHAEERVKKSTATAPMHALLLPRGLESPALKLLQQHGLDGHGSYTMLTPSNLRHLGPVAAYTTLIIDGAPGSASAKSVCDPKPLPTSLLSCPCLAAALAVIASDEVNSEATSAVEMISGESPVLSQAAVSAAVELLYAYQPDLRAKLVRFSVGTIRGGNHLGNVTSVSISKAIAHELTEGAGQASCGEWRGDLTSPNVQVVCILEQAKILVGFLLPPFDVHEKNHIIPRFPLRNWFTCRQRLHTAPFVAATLVQMANVAEGQTLLDACGGIGTIVIEAALQFNLAAAISIEIDAEACAIAEQHVKQAGLEGRVAVQCGDALKLLQLGVEPCSVDVVISDLPFGRRHNGLNLMGFLPSLWSVVKNGGRALLLGDNKLASGLVKCADLFRKKYPWEVKSRVPFYFSGLPVEAVLLVKLPSPQPVKHMHRQC